MRRLYRYSFSLALWTLGVLCCGCSESDTDDPLPPNQPYLTLAQEPLTAYPATGGNGKMIFSTSETWEVLFEPAQTQQSTTADDTAVEPWYAAAPLSGQAGKDHVVAITIQSNPTYFPRGAVLVLRSKSLEKRFEITQAKKNVILLGDNRCEIGSEQQTLSVEVQSNVDYTVTVKTGGGWIGELPESRAAPGLEARTHRFTIAANPDAQERTGVIVFTDKDSDLSDELTVVQAAWEDPDPERSALQALYDAAGGGGWTRSDNWGSDRPLGEWYGVETDAEGRVIALRLPNNNLSGAILKHVGKLTSLRHVDLSHNALEENLDFYEDRKWQTHFGTLTALETLDLNHNRISGGMCGDWERMTRLRYVDLSSNRLDMFGVLQPWMFENGRFVDVILNNNFMGGSYLEFLQQHPQWSRIALQTMRQKQRIISSSEGAGGLRYEQPVVLPDFSFTDLRDGSQRSMRDLYTANKLTMLLQWDPTDEGSLDFAEKVVKRFHTLYGAQGFAVVAITPEGDEYKQAAERYLLTHEVAWPVVMDYADADGKRIVLPTEPYPSFLLVDQYGEVVEDMYPGKRISDPFWVQGTPPTAADLTGRPFEIIDMLNSRMNETFGYSTYRSTDYSMDKRYETLQTSSQDKSIDIVLIGEAFTDVDIETGFYRQVMDFAMESFFALEPLKSYREYFNVHMVYAVSRDTHIGYWNDDIETALGVNRKERGGWFDAELSILRTLPDYYHLPVSSQVLIPAVGVVINNAEGGVAYLNSIVIKPCFAFTGYVYGDRRRTWGTFIHETAGHAFGLLGDEYDKSIEAPYQRPISESDKLALENAQSKEWHLNLSLSNDPKQVPWSHLIGHTRFPYVEIHEGGYYYPLGVWRSENESVMRSSRTVPYFNAPSRELIVKRIMELSGEAYTFEKFLTKDSDAGRPGKSDASALRRSPYRYDDHHQPPILGE